MKNAARVSFASNNLNEQHEAAQQRDEDMQHLKAQQKLREEELDVSVSQNDEKMSITNERKNILEKISK